MIIQSKYTKRFISDSLTMQKYNELYQHALYLRDFKNKISNEISSDLMTHLDMKSLAFVTLMREKHKGELSSSFDKQLYQQVIDAYKNRFDAINRNMTFEVKTFKGIEYYKRQTKEHKKGDFKKFAFTKKSTRLSICLSYLARYGNDNIIEYIKEQFDKVDEKKRRFYQSILDVVDKFGFERLYELAKRKHDRIFRHYAEIPIEFKSLTFSGRSRKKRIVEYNSNYKSIIKAFVSLSWNGRQSMDIPVRYSKDYHGRMKDFFKNNYNYEYVITFDERNKEIAVNICKDGDRYIPDVNESSGLVGIDVNVKHNLFSLSDGTTYDYDRKLVNEYAKLCKEVDNLKKADKDYKLSKRKQWKFDRLKHKMIKREEQIISTMCRSLQSQGVNHIVMENLDNGFGRSFAKDAYNENINFNRVVGFLGISSLKNMVEHIAAKYGIAVSTVHSCYTSKMCPVCGCIEDENRPNQETFSCIECGHKDNADFNAAVNIKNRVAVTVLRQKLLKQKDNGAFEPRKLKREKVKEVLLSYRTTSLLRTENTLNK